MERILRNEGIHIIRSICVYIPQISFPDFTNFSFLIP